MPALKCFRKPCQGNSPSCRPQPSVFKSVHAAVCPPSNASARLAKATLPATGPSHLFLRAFKPAVCPPSNASAGPSHLFFFICVQACRLLGFKCLKPFHKRCQGNSPSYRPQPSVFKVAQACRLPALKCFRSPCQGNFPSYRPQPSVFDVFKPAACPPASASNPSAGLAKATLPAIVPSHLFLRAFKPAVCPPSNASASLAKATLPATGPSHLFLRAFKAAVARLQMLPQTLPR